MVVHAKDDASASASSSRCVFDACGGDRKVRPALGNAAPARTRARAVDVSRCGDDGRVPGYDLRCRRLVGPQTDRPRISRQPEAADLRRERHAGRVRGLRDHPPIRLELVRVLWRGRLHQVPAAAQTSASAAARHDPPSCAAARLARARLEPCVALSRRPSLDDDRPRRERRLSPGAALRVHGCERTGNRAGPPPRGVALAAIPCRLSDFHPFWGPDPAVPGLADRDRRLRVRAGGGHERWLPRAQHHVCAGRPIRGPIPSGMTATPLRLLIADRLRRTNWWAVLFFAASAGVMWWAGTYFDRPSRAIATSMAIALQFGPLMTLRYVPRPLWYLPAARRDVWRSMW